MAKHIVESSIDTVTIGTAVQDIWSLLAGAGNGNQIRWMQLSASAVSAPAELRLRLKRGTVTVTLGSAGSTPSKNLVDSNDGYTPLSTIHANDTTQATTSGNFTGFVKYFQWNVLLPWDYMPGPEEEDRPACAPSQAWILDLPTTIVATGISGFIVWRELP